METFEQQFDWVLRVGLAAVLGALVGLERARNGKPAGMRTHLVVCLGAAVMSAAGAGAPDPTRIAAQVVSGIGFLGAALILRDQFRLRNLTSAASLWAVAGVGIAAGLGWVWLGVGATVLLILALAFLDEFERRVVQPHVKRWRVTVELPAECDPERLETWRAFGLSPMQREVTLTAECRRATIDLRVPPDLDAYKLLASLRAEGARRIEWETQSARADDDPE